jgi:SPX domain protein involved in polyphosphate accumulation
MQVKKAALSAATATATGSPLQPRKTLSTSDAVPSTSSTGLEGTSWSRFYLDFEQLNQRLVSVKREFGMRKSISTRSLTGETHSFAEILDLEAEKIVLFYLRVQGDLARKVWELREQHFRATAAKVRFLAHGGGDVGDSTLSLSQIDSLCERYRSLGQEVLDLLEYLDFNVLALRRIVRKHDKHFKSKMSAVYFDSRLSGDGNNTALVQLVSEAI